jgi:hypothetical protein
MAVMSDRPRIDEACRDSAEVLTLSISRFIAAAYMTGDAACWDAAFACAEEVLGPADSPRVVGAVAGVMRALKVERLEPWSFMPASCCRVTENECDLIAALQFARRGESSAVEEAACRLTGINDAPRLSIAIIAAASLLDGLGAVMDRPSGARPSARLH